MKKLSLLIITLFSSLVLFAQEKDYNFNRASVYVSSTGHGGNRQHQASAVQVNACGDTYISGHYRGTVDFSLGSGTDTFTANNKTEAYTTKTDALGNHLWTATIPDTFESWTYRMFIDSEENVISSGYFWSAIEDDKAIPTDFDPGPGVFNMTSNVAEFNFNGNVFQSTDENGFIQKLDKDGNFLWAANLGTKTATSPKGFSRTRIRALAVDSQDNIYAAGETSAGYDFNPDPDEEFIVNSTNFLIKLDKNGNFIWGKELNVDRIYAIEIDINNNIFLSGMVSTEPGFVYNYPNGTSTVGAGGYDALIAKYNQAGDFQWLKMFGGDSLDYCHYIDSDADGNLYTVGASYKDPDVDPSPTNELIIKTNGIDIIMQKLDNDGNLIWGKGFGGNGRDIGEFIQVDHEGNIHITGEVSAGSFSFSTPDGGTVTEAATNQNPFLYKFDSNGDYLDFYSITGGSGSDPNYEFGRGLDTDIYGNVYLAGSAHPTLASDYGDGIDRLGSMYMLKLSKKDEILATNEDQCKDEGEDFDPVTATVTKNIPFDTWSWDFGDPESGDENTSNLENPPAHTYTKPGTYTITLTASYGCYPPITIEKEVYMYYKPIIDLQDVSVCTNSVTLDAGNSGATYLWSTGETTQTITVANPTPGTASEQDISVTVTNGPTCAVEDDIKINFVPAADPTIRILATSTLICSGEEVTFNIQQQSSEGDTPTYQWLLNGNAIAGETGITFKSSTLANNDEISLRLTSNALCVTTNPVVSEPIAIEVSSEVTPMVTIKPDPEKICEGETYTIIIDESEGGGPTPAYQWYVNGVLESGATDTIFTKPDLQEGDEVYVVLTSSSSCATVSDDDSNVHTVSFTEPVTPKVTIKADSDSVCSGSEYCISVDELENEGTSPTYAWYINGVQDTSVTGKQFCKTGLEENDKVMVKLTSSESCISNDVVESNAITVTYATSLVPKVSIKSDNTSVCSSSEYCISIDEVENEGTNPTYVWYVNDIVDSSITGIQFCKTGLQEGDKVFVELTSSSNCANSDPVKSDPIIIKFAEDVTTKVSIKEIDGATNDESCFEVDTVVNEGTSPTYQWYVNGSAVSGETNTKFCNAKLSSNDVIKVGLISSSACASSDQVYSNEIKIGEQPLKDVEVSLAITSTEFCQGSEICLQATTKTDSTNSLTFEWKVNGNIISDATEKTYCSTNFSSSDLVTVTVSCVDCNTKDSNEVTVNIFNPSSLDIGEDVTINEGEEFILNPEDTPEEGTYKWTSSDGEILDGKVQIVKPTVTTTYTLAFTTTSGCTSEDSFIITVNPTEKKITKHGFSPDGDGINDTWSINGIEDYPNNTVFIYNRWGDMVFKMNNYDNDSKSFTGEANTLKALGAGQLPEGTYFFKIEIPEQHNLKQTEGFLVLKR